MTKLMEGLYNNYFSTLEEEVINADRAKELSDARQIICDSLNEEQTKQLNDYLNMRSEKEEYLNSQCFVGGMNCLAKILMEALVGP